MFRVAAIALVSFGTAAAVVPLARRFAERRGLLDVPNERSSHKLPTPRIGGVGIAAGAIAGIAVFVALGAGRPEGAQLTFFAALIAGAVVGFLDDIVHLETALRMLAYLVCAAGLAVSGASISHLELPGLPSADIGVAGGLVFSALFVAWYANLFNFMDGIDGIAGCAAAVALGALGAVFIAHGETTWGALAVASAAASVGFLLYNFPPATVFMGDGGAVFLGLALGALSLVAGARGMLALPAAVLLMFPFVFDATFTLLRRILRRERFWAAHRTHVYQQMCDLGLSHRAVTLVYTAAALLCAALGLAYGVLPAWGRALAFYGVLVAALAVSLLVIVKNRRRSKT